MSTPDAMGLTPSAAAGYEEFFVPAIFDQWPAQIIRQVQIADGDDVLEVGCGTGVFAREAVKHVGASGRVTAIDLSENMLGVARNICPDVEFRQANAMNLPFEDASFDVAVSSFVLMFVPEPERVVREMLRVLKPNGRLFVAVWESLQQNPAYSRLVNIARSRIDDDAGVSLAMPFALGEEGCLANIFQSVGGEQVDLSYHKGRAKFPSLESFITTEIRAWVLGDRVDEKGLAEVIEDAREQYREYCDEATGALDIPLNAVFAKLTKTAY